MIWGHRTPLMAHTPSSRGTGDRDPLTYVFTAGPHLDDEKLETEGSRVEQGYLCGKGAFYVLPFVLRGAEGIGHAEKHMILSGVSSHSVKASPCGGTWISFFCHRSCLLYSQSSILQGEKSHARLLGLAVLFPGSFKCLVALGHRVSLQQAISGPNWYSSVKA